MTNQPIPKVKAEATQLGLAIDASIDGGNTWQCVQLTAFKPRTTDGKGIAPWLDIEEYFAELDRRGVKYERVKG